MNDTKYRVFLDGSIAVEVSFFPGGIEHGQGVAKGRRRGNQSAADVMDWLIGVDQGDDIRAAPKD
jgi:hypothetical protein